MWRNCHNQSTNLTLNNEIESYFVSCELLRNKLRLSELFLIQTKIRTQSLFFLYLDLSLRPPYLEQGLHIEQNVFFSYTEQFLATSEKNHFLRKEKNEKWKTNCFKIDFLTLEEQWFSTGVPRHTRVAWGSVRVAASYKIYWCFDMFWHVGVPLNIEMDDQECR